MIEQITLKNANISDKSLHLSVQKTYSHKQGNNHSLDRSEVTGSGKKLFKQKGTGNARAGNKKTTQRRGGGKAFGPKFHLVSFKVNKKLFESYINEYSSLFGQKGSIASNILRDDIQKESWKKIGPVRTAKGIKGMEDKIKEIEEKLNNISIPNYFIWNQSFIDFVELKNMICSAKLIGLAAKERNGSIGGHVRLDAKNISIFSRPYSTVVHKNNNTYYILISRLESDPYPKLSA